ncbi:hypothetical protein FJ364_02890 [Candidatus Dependentiae bacterium]|nr:hypothetical protein [Candidatus Dependentiae bacterium]
MYSWLVLLPPVIVIILATLTRKISWSILAGIITGLLIVHNFSLPVALQDLVVRLQQTAVAYVHISAFLLLLAVLVTLLEHSGGAYAYGNFVMKYLKRPEHAEKASLLLSMFFCVDDYFGSLTVGSVMQPLTDKFKIARVKLALLVNGMAAPLVVLFPVSSWVAEIIIQLRQSGIESAGTAGALIQADLLPFYVSTIPFLFYAFLAIAALWFLVISRLSFGLLHKHEEIAQRTGNLFAGKMPLNKRFTQDDQVNAIHASLADFLFPILLLFLTVFIGILYFGEWTVFGGQNSFIYALQKSNVAAALFYGASVTLFVSLLFLLVRRKIRFQSVPRLFYEGFMLMFPSVITLILIWTLSGLLKGDLATGKYLAGLLGTCFQLTYLPMSFFLLAALTATTMGSCWGTIGIYVPIAVPMLVALSGVATPTTVTALPLIVPLIGAIISGAVVGNHLSPISDTMLMSSTSTGAYHIDVVRVQFTFTMPIIAASAIAFLAAGIMLAQGMPLGATSLISFAIGLACMMIFFKLLAFLTKRK